MYMWDSRCRDTAALYALNLETGDKTLTANDHRADLLDYSMENILIRPKEKTIQAVAANYERKHWQIIDPSIKDDFNYLSTVAEGDFSVMSQTLDNNAWIVAYNLDDGPGRIYYYDRIKREAKLLSSGSKELEGRPFAKMHPVKKGIVDPKRIAIMGGSYGGYATLVGLTSTPETFACGVDMYGPSSLVTLIENFPAWMTPTMGRLATTIGNLSTEDGQKLLTERSTLNYVDQIQRPLLVCQGANDPIVKRNESDQIVQAMQENNLSVIYVLFSDEGHYIARPENNIALYAVAEVFLSQHLGGQFELIGDDLQGSSITVPVGAEEIPGLEVALSEKHQGEM
jgi:dipeptidyl aminopeptidase/acylaminoacyl peptidase